MSACWPCSNSISCTCTFLSIYPSFTYLIRKNCYLTGRWGRGGRLLCRASLCLHLMNLESHGVMRLREGSSYAVTRKTQKQRKKPWTHRRRATSFSHLSSRPQNYPLPSPPLSFPVDLFSRTCVADLRFSEGLMRERRRALPLTDHGKLHQLFTQTHRGRETCIFSSSPPHNNQSGDRETGLSVCAFSLFFWSPSRT